MEKTIYFGVGNVADEDPGCMEDAFESQKLRAKRLLLRGLLGEEIKTLEFIEITGRRGAWSVTYDRQGTR